MWGGIEDGFVNLCCSIPVGGKTLTADIPAIVFAGMLGPLGLSKDEHLWKINYSLRDRKKRKDLYTVGSGGFVCKDFVFVVDVHRVMLILVSAFGVATGLAGCERLCSGAWKVYTVNAGLWCPFS